MYGPVCDSRRSLTGLPTACSTSSRLLWLIRVSRSNDSLQSYPDEKRPGPLREPGLVFLRRPIKGRPTLSRLRTLRTLRVLRVSEVDGEVETHEPRRVDRVRAGPRVVKGRHTVRVGRCERSLEARCVVRVEQVP